MKQFATFRLDDRLFGIEVLLVREINQVLDITPVPQAAPYIRGLINLRGQIITIFDLGVRLGLEPRVTGDDSHIVILKTEDELNRIRLREGGLDLRTATDSAGLLVDALGDVVEADESLIEPPPLNLGPVEGRFLSFVVKLEREVLLVLNVAQALEPAQAAGAEPGHGAPH